jgi:hypothetical protein
MREIMSRLEEMEYENAVDRCRKNICQMRDIDDET